MDDLERQFAELEREVRQRECGHERLTERLIIGEPRHWMCLDCFKRVETVDWRRRVVDLTYTAQFATTGPAQEYEIRTEP